MTDRGDTYGGIFWVRATEGGWQAATPGESCAEIERLRAENARLREALKNISTGLAVMAHKPKPSAKPSDVEGRS